MGIFDKAKEMLGDSADKVDQGLDQPADYADERTGPKYSEPIGSEEARASDGADDSSVARDAAINPPVEPLP